ncbi:GPW/gp25 family protein [Halalkalibaculum sp. DA384]|uniref:GPW/gp25 family protein n=1 Tax=Halalkalibaculum sp. DA384 TaxID=3373606 RepID=UPI00375480E5
MDEGRSFLGKGWGFPPAFVRGSRSVDMTQGAEDINLSLTILFTTMTGERVMQPRYGCDLSQFQFEPIDTTMITYMTEVVRDAILYFEPRIRLIDLTLVPFQHEGRINITLEYEIKKTNSRFNYVFPFYKEEGSNID